MNVILYMCLLVYALAGDERPVNWTIVVGLGLLGIGVVLSERDDYLARRP